MLASILSILRFKTSRVGGGSDLTFVFVVFQIQSVTSPFYLYYFKYKHTYSFSHGKRRLVLLIFAAAKLR
jgi:hypothetical protein